MVDKVDRPDPIYKVHKSPETHDEGQRRQDERHDDESEFSSPGFETSWNKYQARGSRRKVITLQRSDVQQAIFRQASLKHHSAVLEADLTLRDGRVLSRAAYVSNNMDDYWKWKGWVPGQSIPIEILIQNQLMQVSIPLPDSTFRGTEDHAHSQRSRTPLKRRPWQHPTTGRIHWLWLVKVTAALIIGAWVVGKWARWW